MDNPWNRNTNNPAPSGTIGLDVILFVTFLVLKLTHVIDWSWWWITAPLWIPIAVVILLTVILMIITSRYDLR